MLHLWPVWWGLPPKSLDGMVGVPRIISGMHTTKLKSLPIVWWQPCLFIFVHCGSSQTPSQGCKRIFHKQPENTWKILTILSIYLLYRKRGQQCPKLKQMSKKPASLHSSVKNTLHAHSSIRKRFLFNFHKFLCSLEFANTLVQEKTWTRKPKIRSKKKKKPETCILAKFKFSLKCYMASCIGNLLISQIHSLHSAKYGVRTEEN